jgi:hypothetical protein
VTGWNFACADWEQRLREGRSLVPDLPLFQDKADRAKCQLAPRVAP